jgi:hypothetical protein
MRLWGSARPAVVIVFDSVALFHFGRRRPYDRRGKIRVKKALV